MTDKVVAITGAYGALGRAAVRAARDAGYRVAAVDVAPTAPAESAAHLKLTAVDLTSPAAAEKAFAEIDGAFGRLDALVNIAGGFVWQTVADGEAEAWNRLFAINLKTALNAARAALPHLKASGDGAIVNIGAHAAAKAAAGMGAYTASKAAVHKLTESLAEEMKGSVTVNALLPSIIDTAQNRADMPSADFSTWVEPEEIAAAILFLISDKARAITGALIPIVGRV